VLLQNSPLLIVKSAIRVLSEQHGSDLWLPLLSNQLATSYQRVIDGQLISHGNKNNAAESVFWQKSRLIHGNFHGGWRSGLAVAGYVSLDILLVLVRCLLTKTFHNIDLALETSNGDLTFEHLQKRLQNAIFNECRVVLELAKSCLGGLDNTFDFIVSSLKNFEAVRIEHMRMLHQLLLIQRFLFLLKVFLDFVPLRLHDPTLFNLELLLGLSLDLFGLFIGLLLDEADHLVDLAAHVFLGTVHIETGGGLAGSVSSKIESPL